MPRALLLHGPDAYRACPPGSEWTHRDRISGQTTAARGCRSVPDPT